MTVFYTIRVDLCDPGQEYHASMETRGRSPRPDLVRLRQNAGLSQAQLAAALGLSSPRAIKAWESGAYAPSMSHAVPLARVLGVPLQEVIEAVAGPDPGADQTLPDATPSPMAALVHHLAEATRLARLLQEAQASTARHAPAPDAERPEAEPSPSGQEPAQEPGTRGG
jgi:transcriptional regulator with XRE-family HTH domain